MLTHRASTLKIDAVTPDERQRALETLLHALDLDSRRERARQICLAAERGETPLDGLLVARGAGEWLAVAWAQLQPGRSANVWAPCFCDPAGAAGMRAGKSAGESSDPSDLIATRLLAAAVDVAAAAGARLAQALLGRGAELECRWFAASGFYRAADLDFLYRSLSPADALPLSDDGLRGLVAIPYDDTLRTRLLAVLAETYRGTRDCPALEGLRDPAEVLAGYEASGNSGTRYWRLLMHREEVAGCVLLAECVDQAEFELVYMGLAPEFRGRGLGRAAVAHALRTCALAGGRRLVLAVDAANARAQAVYAAENFVRWDERGVWIRKLSEP